MEKKNKIIVMIIIIVSMILFLSAGTLAYWYWSNIDDAKNLVVSIAGVRNSDINYTEGESLYLGDFKPTNTFCESSSTTLSFSKNERVKDINLSATIHLDINSIGTNISDSDSVYWVVTSGENSITCEEGLDSSTVLSYGTFKGVQTNDVLDLYSVPVTTSTQTFTVWIWIASAGSNLENLSGESLDVNVWTEIVMAYSTAPNRPELDDGMIPVTIANDGKLTIVSQHDPSWYNYSNKEWANVVLVNENATSGVENSHPRSYYQDADNIGEEVTKEDVLAYYVWIPRYKYRISTNTYCGDIEGIATPETHPECYKGSYTLTVTEDEAKQHITNTINNAKTENPEITDSYCNIEYGIYDALIAGGYDENRVYEFGLYGLEDFLPADAYTYKLVPNRIVTGNPTSIDIEFEMKEETMVLGNATTQYRTHPAFWWDDDSDAYLDNGELISGIWVGKFATTRDKTNDCDLGEILGCSTTLSPTILPSEIVLKNQIFGYKFDTSRNISKEGNIYGLDNETINAHMMKNRDWGAVAYLSHSEYGINGEIRNNNYSSSGTNLSLNMTGCGALTKNGSSTTDCENEFGTVETYPQSTTGNISGIFDMSVGVGEQKSYNDRQYTIVMGNYGKSHFFINDGNMGEMPELKYYDLYSEDDFPVYGDLSVDFLCTMDTCGGHALNETKGWYNTSIFFVNTNYFTFIRYDLFGADEGDAGEFDMFRSVLVTGFGD